MKRIPMKNGYLMKYLIPAVALGALAAYIHFDTAVMSNLQHYCSVILFIASPLLVIRMLWVRLACIKFDEKGFKRFFKKYSYDDIAYVSFGRWEMYGQLKLFLRGHRVMIVEDHHYEGLGDFVDEISAKLPDGVGRDYDDEADFIAKRRTEKMSILDFYYAYKGALVMLLAWLSAAILAMFMLKLI